MQITKISCDNFLQIKGMDLDMTEGPVHLVCGLNESGKSSLHEAVKFALLGETARVTLKRDYKQMVRLGAKDGAVRVDYIDEEGNHDYVHREVSTGKLLGGFEGEQAFAVAEAMDATKYPALNAKHQRDMIRELLNIVIDPNDVVALLKRQELTEETIEMVKPMLRAGFEAAHTEAKNRQSEARAKWEQIAGERWGTAKGADWKPEKKPVVQAVIDAQEKAVAKALKLFEQANQNVGSTGSYQGGHSFPCPSCKTQLVVSGHSVKLASDEPDKAAMKASTAAKAEADKLRDAWSKQRGHLESLMSDMDFNNRMEEIEKEASKLDKQVHQWLLAAELLAPDGIPGQIIGEKLKPLNDRLRDSSVVSGWDQVIISASMDIMIGTIPYMLGSESAQWRAQAMIAEAISFLSGIGLICLDRIDVLDLPNRAKLIKWIMSIKDDHNTILMFGTLKEPPKLPKDIVVHWMEVGNEVKTA